MALMKGHKETTVGVIPADWQVVPITSLIEKNSRITYGVVQPGKDDPRGVEFIRGGDVYDGKIDKENLRRIPRYVDSQYSRTKLHGGELLISLVGFPGECAIVPEALKGANIARQVALARLDKDLGFEPDFICHFLRSSVGKKLLLREAFGSAQQVINLKDVNKLELPLPSLLEQKDITTALSDADALIAGLEKLIAKKHDLKQAAMQQLLTGQTRLPGFSGKWVVKRLGDLAEMGSGGTPPSANAAYYGGEIPWVAIADMTGGGKYIADTERNLTELGLANSAAQMFPAGTVLYAMYASLGECSIATVPVTTSQAILGIRPKANLSSEFLYYLLTSWKPMVKGLGQQGTQANLNKGIVADFKISMPALEEQESIAAVLIEMDNELAAFEARLAQTRDLKQGMMQELLTGRTRLV